MVNDRLQVLAIEDTMYNLVLANQWIISPEEPLAWRVDPFSAYVTLFS